MRLTDWRRQPWRADLALLLTLCLLFLPAWVGLQGGSGSASAMAQTPAVATRPILVVPLQAAEGVPAGVAEGVTFALVEELEASRQFSPTRLSLDEPTVQRLIREGQLTEETVAEVLQQPTPEDITQIASAMKVADAVYGTVDSYTYDPKANGGVVKVKVTARFLKIDLTTGAVTETKEISKEGSSAPKLAPRPEKELAVEAFRQAARQVISEFLGLPAPPPPPPPPKAVSALPFLVGLLLLGALIGAGRGKGAPAPAVAPGPANAPSRVTAFPQGSAIVVTWQPPAQGSPIGYNLYRADAGLAARQGEAFQRLNPTPIPTTQYTDTQVVPGRLYLYAVTAVYPNNAESERVPANVELMGQPVPVGIGVPLPPRNLQAQPGDGSVRLTWEDPNPSGFVKGYRIYRQAGAPPTDANLIADETTVRTTTFIDRGLSNGTPYFYVVRAVSTQGYLSAPSMVVSATPGNLPPQAPTLSGQFNPATFTVTLSWTPSPDPDIAYYEVARVVESIQRSRALTTRVTRQTPIINLPPGVARRVLQTNPRLRQVSSPFDNNIIATNVTATSFQDLVAQFRPNGQAPTTYYVLRYAVRAVDQSGNKGAWSNAIEITPNSPPPSLSALRPRLIPSNGQVLIDLKPLLDFAAGDAEWQVDKKGVRIFRSTTKGGTQAPALTPIHSVDPLPFEQLDQGRYFRDTQVSNGTRYFYAVELVDKLGVAGGRSQEGAVTPFASATITIAAQGNRTELSGNGQDSVRLTLSVVDANNRPIAGFPLLVSLTGQGTLTVDPAYQDPQVPGGAITDENGQAIAVYQAPTVTSDTTATITAAPGGGVTGIASASLTLTVRTPRVASIDVRPQKTQLTADGLDVTDVIITVKDTLGQTIPNKTVNLAVSPADPTNFGRFEDLSGNPIPQTTTGTDGTAKVRYRAGKRTGSVTLQASVTEGATTISGQGVVTLVPGAPATIELVANPSSAPADGSTEVRLTATVRDAQGNAVPRVKVQFSATPSLAITPSSATTDDTGQATVTVTAPTKAGSYTLQAQVGTIAATLTLTFGAGSASTLTLSASRTDLLVSLPPAFEGVDYTGLAPFARADITVTVLDANNNPVPSAVVQFSATFGTIQASAMTNAAGIAKATYVAPTTVPPGGQVTINAQAGTATGSIQLNILPGPPAKVRITANPLLLPADGRSQSQVRAEVRDANDNLVTDGVLVVFSARNPNNLSQTTTEAGQFLQSQVPTINGVAIANFIAGTQPGKSAVLVAQAFSMEQSFGPVPAENKLVALNQQGLLPTVQLGGQVQLVASAVEISVSDRDDTTNPSDRRPLWLQPPTDNFLTLTIQLVDGRGQPSALPGQPVFLSSTDARLLLVDLVTSNAGLGSLQVLTDASGKAQVLAYASRKAGEVTVTAELRDALGRPFSSQSVLFRQRAGAPATVVIPPPQPNVLFVPGAGTPTSTTITASVFDAANNPVEDGVLVTFTADAGTLAPTQATTLKGSASTTLSSSPDSGWFTVKATASVPGQQQPAVGTTVVAFAVNVTSIQVQADHSSIVGDGMATAQVRATFTGTIPNNTRVRVLTDRGFIGQTGQKSALVPVVGNVLVVTFLSEAVTADTTATVRVQAINPQGNLVEGTTQITMIRPPKLPILQPLQVQTTTLSVSSSNSTNPNQRTALGPEPNSTTVTVLVQEQDTNLPVQGAVVTLSSSDPNGLWVDANNNASLGGIQVTTGSNGRAVVTYYTSTDTPNKQGEGTVTLTASLGAQQKTAQLTVRAGNPANVTIAISSDNMAPDGVPFIFVPGAGTPTSATITATVRDAANNAVRNGTQVTFAVVENEGNFVPTNQVATSNNAGQAQVTLQSSPATGEFTIRAQANSATGTAKIRYAANVPDITNITANPATIPDDGQTTSVITVQLPAPDGTRFRISTNLGVLISGTQTGSAVVATVSNGQAQVQFRGPGTSTTTQTATVTAEVVGTDGSKKSKSTQVQLLPRIEVIATFPMTAPNRLVVSSSNSTDPGQRQPLDGVAGNNRAQIQVIVRGQPPANKAVSLLASEGNILFEVTQGSNQGTKQLATVTGNLVQVGNEFRYTVNMYSSTLAGNFTVRVDVPGLNNYNTTIPFTQLAGPPGAIVVSAASNRIGVQGHPTLPTSTTITAIVRDAVGNPIDGAFVFFSADDGVLNRIAASTQNGTATTTLTSSNFTRRVRVFGKVIGVGGQEITNFTLVSFVVGNLAGIDLVPDRSDIPPNEVANVTVIFNPASEMPNNVRFVAELRGAYGILEPPTLTQNGQAKVIVRNNNPTNANQLVQLTVRAIRQDGLELTKSLNLNLLPSQVIAQVELQTNPSQIVVSNNDTTTNPVDRIPLSGTNKATLTLFVRGLNAGESVSVTLDSTDPRGLFVPPTALNVSNSVGTISFNITDNGPGDSDTTPGTIKVSVDYYSSRKAQSVTIRATVNRNNQLYGQSAVGIFQVPGPPANILLTSSPTLIPPNGQATVLAYVSDANGNPTPNQSIRFRIVPTLANIDPLNDPPEVQETAGNPQVSDGVVDPSVAVTDANGLALTNLRSPNVSEPVKIRAEWTGNTSVFSEYQTAYFVTITGVRVSVDFTHLQRLVTVTFDPGSNVPAGIAVWVYRTVRPDYWIDLNRNGTQDANEIGQGAYQFFGYQRFLVTQTNRLEIPLFVSNDPTQIERGTAFLRVFLYDQSGRMVRVRVDYISKP